MVNIQLVRLYNSLWQGQIWRRVEQKIQVKWDDVCDLNWIGIEVKSWPSTAFSALYVSLGVYDREMYSWREQLEKNEKLESFNLESPTWNWKEWSRKVGLKVENSGWSGKVRTEVGKDNRSWKVTDEVGKFWFKLEIINEFGKLLLKFEWLDSRFLFKNQILISFRYDLIFWMSKCSLLRISFYQVVIRISKLCQYFVQGSSSRIVRSICNVFRHRWI